MKGRSKEFYSYISCLMVSWVVGVVGEAQIGTASATTTNKIDVKIEDVFRVFSLSLLCFNFRAENHRISQNFEEEDILC